MNIIIVNRKIFGGFFFFLFLIVRLNVSAQFVTIHISGKEEDIAIVDSKLWYIEEFNRGSYRLLDSIKSSNGKGIFCLNLKRSAYCKIYIPSLHTLHFIFSPYENQVQFIGNYESFLNGNYVVLNSSENQCMFKYRQEESDFGPLYGQIMYAKTRPENNTTTAIQILDSTAAYYLMLHNQRMKTIASEYPRTYCSTQVIPNRMTPSYLEQTKWREQYVSNDTFLKYHFFDYFTLVDSAVLSIPSFFDFLNTYQKWYIKDSIILEKAFLNWFIGNNSVHPRIREFLFNYYFQMYIQSNRAELVEYMLLHLSHPLLDFSSNNNKLALTIDKLLPHKSAPEIELPDITGKMRKLSEMAISHDINLLVFYSHDCEHCQKLMLNLVDLYKTKHHQSFGVFAVDINSDEKDWKKFLTENRVPFTSTILTNESKIKLRKDYAILAVPTMILIDRNMEIISLFPSIEIVQKYLD